MPLASPRDAAIACDPMTLWNKVRANRADRVVGARGRLPSPEKLHKQTLKANYEGQRAHEAQPQNTLKEAAEAALRRLKTQGYPGAVQIADPKRKLRSAWYLCEVLANRPHGETAVSRY